MRCPGRLPLGPVRFLRAPWLHFLLVGTLLFVVARWQGRGETSGIGRTIVITAAQQTRLREDFQRQFGRVPSPAAVKALVADAIEDEVLYREALAHGLDQGDRVVRNRLLQLARFVGEQGASELDEERLIERARQLGLDRSDLVIRRYLVQRMRLLGSQPSAGDLPDEEALQGYLERKADQFRRPERVRLTHVYLSRDRRGARLAGDAERSLGDLRRAGRAPETAADLGDPFIRGRDMAASSEQDLARAFGPEFAPIAMDLPTGSWEGPVPSSYGLHLVWVHERIPGGMPPLAAVRNQVVHGVLQERKAASLAARLAGWRAAYTVEIEGDDA